MNEQDFLQSREKLDLETQERVSEMKDIQDQMFDLLTEAEDILADHFQGDVRFERAKCYWISHIRGAIGNFWITGGSSSDSHDLLGGSMHTMTDSINEMTEEDDDE